MNDKTLRVLEYNKILNKMVEYTGNASVRERILNMRPSSDIIKIQCLQNETTEGVKLFLGLGSAPNLDVGNIIGGIKRLEIGGILSLRELLDVSNLLKVVRSLKAYIDEGKDIPLLTEYSTSLFPLRQLENSINDIVLSEDTIADHASRELYNLRRSIRMSGEKVKELLNGIIHSAKYQKYLQDSIVTMRGDRYVVPVKSEHKADISGIVHDASASGATLFIEPMSVVQENNRLRELYSKEKQEIERIVTELSSEVAEHTDTIRLNFTTVLDFDFIFARSRLSLDHNGIEPHWNNRGYINIKKGRHPLLDFKSVVPVDIHLGSSFDTLIITGPNTGGKTVALKTVGLFVLMAQSGLHIPAFDGSEMSVFTNIFADIGDEQSIEQSLSTFSAHMVNIVDILSVVDSETLVLFDELGAGTDPAEGAALAMSILEYCRNMGAKVMATTHYSELKIFALSTNGVENASCEFDITTLRPTYKLLIGVPGKSNAFAISKRLGLPDFVIDKAKEVLTDENIQFEDVIAKLEKNTRLAEEEKQKAEAYLRESRQIKTKLEEQQRTLEKKQKEILDKARQEAAELIAGAQEEAKDAIREINRLSKLVNTSDIQKQLEQQRTRLKKNFDEVASKTTNIKRSSEVPKNLKAGDTVEILSIGQTASVLDTEDKNGDIMLQAGIMKIKSNVSDLRLVEDDNAKKTVQSILKQRSGGFSKTASIKTEIDIRGHNVEEAIYVLDKYLDDVCLGGLQKITVIHGKGTGVLRSGIHEFLRRDNRVKSYRSGVYGEGENGVTVVEMK